MGRYGGLTSTGCICLSIRPMVLENYERSEIGPDTEIVSVSLDLAGS